MSATASSQNKEAVAPSQAINDIFRQAMLSYEEALKSGIQLQEESVKLWKELLTKLGSPEEFHAKLESLNSETFPAASNRMGAFLETFCRTSDQTLALFQKSLAPFQAASINDARSRIQDLLESSLTALRVNVHTALNTNAKIMAGWQELVGRVSPSAE